MERLSLIPILLLFCLNMFAQIELLCDSTFNESYAVQDTPVYVDYLLNGAIESCDDILRYEVHFDMDIVPDRFEVFVNGSSSYLSDWLGDVDYILTGTVREGFFDHFVYLNGTWDFGPSPSIPNSYRLEHDIAKGKGRLFIWAFAEDTVVLRMHMNPISYSQYELHSICKTENEIVRTETAYTCHIPIDTVEYITTNFNCDTIIIDSVYVGDNRVGFPPIRYDTVRNFPEPRPNDTIFILNNYGCRIPIAIMVFLRPPVEPYIPNVITPNGDGTNDIFVISPPQEAKYEIWDRWGNKVFDETTSGGWHPWNKEQSQIGVYTYLITIRQYGEEYYFTGDVTVIR